VQRAVFAAFLRYRHAWLFATLVATIGVDPVAEALGFHGRLLEWLLALSLLTVVAGVSRGLARAFGLAIGAVLVVWLALHVLQFGVASERLLLAGGALGAAVAILPAALGAGRVDSERVCAALCAYLLVGVAFGGLFAALDALAPGSLGGARSSRGALSIDEAVYFSFVTLATLGYGDLVPATGAARALSILEAVFGQLYLAVLVARLVSLYGRER